MLPLTNWQLYARELPEELENLASPSSFVLPGAKALESFADLLGEAAADEEETAPALQSAPFSLPAMLPEGLSGSVSLRREIDFGSLRGDRAVLTLDHIVGSGRILLDESQLCAFDSADMDADALAAARLLTAQPCMLAIDLTDALELGRKETLSIEFDEAQSAGLPGPVMLHVNSGASLSCASLVPDAAQKTVRVSVLVTAVQAGRYVLRAQAFGCDAACEARESALTLEAGQSEQLSFSMPLPAAPFVPGTACDAPAVKLLLFHRKEQANGDGMLCDSAILMCGYAPKAPESWLPLERADAFYDPQKTADTLRALHISAVSLTSPAPDGFYRALCRAGIAVRQHLPREHALEAALRRLPCVCLDSRPEADSSVSLEASAWQLCSMVSAPRTLDETLTPRELLYEASGLPLDPRDEGVRGVLAWLRALSIRLRAEAARQNRFAGALCAAGEWKNPDAESALRTAFAPLHLSALPLCGAWWTLTRFSASLMAFIPRGAYEDGAKLLAQAVLEDGEGRELARFESPCRAAGGYVGVIEATLPEHACVLELTTRLLADGEVIEESTMPVYVGVRGPLEAAFG